MSLLRTVSLGSECVEFARLVVEAYTTPGVVEILRLLAQRDLYTRQLLSLLGSWEQGQIALRRAEELGLVRRYPDPRDKRYIWNSLTMLGRMVLQVLEG